MKDSLIISATGPYCNTALQGSGLKNTSEVQTVIPCREPLPQRLEPYVLDDVTGALLPPAGDVDDTTLCTLSPTAA